MSKILVTGGAGFLGSRVMQILRERNIEPVSVSRRSGFDLTRESETLSAFLLSRPDVVVHLAASVGGIGANMDRPGTFFHDNMRMGLNVVHAAAMTGAKLVLVSTVCGYPKDTPVPFREEDFWKGLPEATNAPYGIAKKALLTMCEGYRRQHGLSYTYLLPANLYGEGDNFHPSTSHVIPALIRKFCEARTKGAREVECWGTGKPTRSFLYVGDAGEAIARAALAPPCPDPINLPGCPEISIADLALQIADLVGYKGAVFWNRQKPDGQPRRALEGTRAKEKLDWEPKTLLVEGLKQTIAWWEKKEKEAPCPTP